MKFPVKEGSARQSVWFRPSIIFAVFLFVTEFLFSQGLPLGYTDYFSHTCSDETLFRSLLPEDERNWKIVKEEGHAVLRIDPPDDSVSFPFPHCRSVLDNLILGDYILEFEVKSVSHNDSLISGFCFLGPVKTKEIYYSMVFSKDTLSFYSIIHDSIQSSMVKSIPSMNTSWNSIRIERNILTRAIAITINNDRQKSVSFSDRNLVMGFIGFGSHHSTSYIRNIRLWAPTAIEEQNFHW